MAFAESATVVTTLQRTVIFRYTFAAKYDDILFLDT